VVFLKVVAVTEAVVTRDGQVRAEGRPCDHATLGPLEEWMDAQAGPGVIDGIAERAVLDARYVKGRYRRLLTAAFMIRVLVLWTLMPEAQLSDVITALAGTWPCCPGRDGGTRRRSGPAWTGGRRLARHRWGNCRPRCSGRRPGSTGSTPVRP
jgi:hypothetical protein